MHIHYLKHVPFEGLGNIEVWAEDRGHLVSCTSFYEKKWKLPSTREFDWLIILGGPMSIKDEAIYPWIREEKEFIHKAIDADKIVLGICLGAQLIADVLGGKVFPNKEREIGWFPVNFNEEALNTSLFHNFPPKLTVFHWHGDTFSLPEQAQKLASSTITNNQAFSYKNKVIGLQFHIEERDASIMQLIRHCEDELVEQSYVQSAYNIMQNVFLTRQNKDYLFKFLDNIYNFNS